MAHTTVIVEYRSSGKPASGREVVLSFTSGLGGVSRAVRTGSDVERASSMLRPGRLRSSSMERRSARSNAQRTSLSTYKQTRHLWQKGD